MKNRFADKSIIPKYGFLLRENSVKTVVDLDDATEMAFDFQIQKLNDMVTEFNGTMPPNRISHYILAYIKSGSEKKTIGNYSFEIEPQMALIFPKRVIHSTENWSLDTSGFMLTFNETLFENTPFPISYLQLPRLFKLSVKPYQILNSTQSKNIEALFVELFQYKNCEDDIDKKIFALKLSELILMYQKTFIKDSSLLSDSHLLFDKFIQLLEDNFRINKEVKYYAERLFIHPNHLNKLVLSNSSLSAKDYIQQRVFFEGKYMVTATGLSIKEIAHDLGFNDYNYFCRQFKKIVGKTPSEYRNKEN